MKFAPFFSVGVALLGLLIVAQPVSARELDFLETDPRFTGGEYNTSNPALPNFWFYDQYGSARTALQANGFSLVPITSITLPNLLADSDAFYMPTPTNLTASTYPLTNTELGVLQQYVALGHSVIFNLTGADSPSMTDDLLTRLGLSGSAGSGSVTGATSYPMPNQPVITGVGTSGPLPGSPGAVGSFTWSSTGYFSSLGKMRSLVNVSGVSVLPYVEKGDLGANDGAYFFLLDPNMVLNFGNETAGEQALFMNVAAYAVQDQYLHYVPNTSIVPEPASMMTSLAGMAICLRRPRRRTAA